MKPLVIVALWVFAFWYLGAAVALFLGAPEILGPVAGLCAGIWVHVSGHHTLRQITERADRR
jgi:hypothetical protein